MNTVKDYDNMGNMKKKHDAQPEATLITSPTSSPRNVQAVRNTLNIV